MNKPIKVKIIISDDHNYYNEVENDGKKYTSVDYYASTYGGAAPCDNKNEIQTAIKHAKSVIRGEGDIPIVIDKREKSTPKDRIFGY